MSTTKRYKASIPQGNLLKKSVQSKTWRKIFRRLLEKMPENIRRWNAALLAQLSQIGGKKAIF